MSDQSSSSVLIVEVSEGVMTVTLNRPDRMNAFDHSLLKALARAWEDALAPEIRAVIITGAGKGFCAGFDLRREPPPPGDASGLRSLINPQVLGLAALAKPVIAAVNGVAAGAGLSLACAADLRIASSHSRFVPAFARVGVIPDGGGTYYIPRLLGWSRAFEWLASSDEVSAQRALEWGLVSEVVEPEELLKRAREKALQLAAMPGDAVGLTKLLLARSKSASLSEQLEHEAECQLLALMSPGREAARAEVASRLNKAPTETDS